MDSIVEFRNWFEQNKEKLKQDYFEFLRFNSVSTDPSYSKDILDCANFLVQYLKKAGITAELLKTAAYPLVYAEDLSAGENAPTLLIYGHYDVQPPEPLDLWLSPPFEPTERDGKIFARGASDDKGQIFYALLGLIAYKELGKKLPVNVKFCIEGEEETQSTGLLASLPDFKEKLKSDAVLIADFDASSDGTPYVTLGGRGCIALEINLKGSNEDLHSGIMGGIAYNPNRALVEILGSFWDETGRVTIPGFYEGVEEVRLSDLRDSFFDFTPENLKRDFGIEAFSNEKGKSLQESNWLRPTLEINGMYGGYTGEGSKTIIPARACAKISCRLVLNQDPDRIMTAIEEFVRKKVPKGMELSIIRQGSGGAFRSDPNCQLAKSLAKAASEVTGKKAANVYSGASIPVTAELSKSLGAQAVGMGYGLSSDQIHAPNENFDMDRLEKGFLTVAKIFENYEAC